MNILDALIAREALIVAEKLGGKGVKLSENQIRLLKIVDNATEWHGDIRPGASLKCYFIPRSGFKPGFDTWGAGDAASFKALERKGLIRKEPIADYAYSITEDGLLALSRL